MCSILLLDSKSNTISKILYTTLTVLQLTQIFTPTHLARSSPASNFELNSPETVHTTHYHFDKQIVPYMQLHKLDPSDSNNVTCNDKSPAGYYKRLNNHSKSWIIYLQGGGYCGSEEACLQRWQTSPYLMSSSYWPKLKTVDGILSSDPKDNPYLWNANHIYIPYCSSDSWTGSTVADSTKSSFAFMGSKILEKVVDSLFEDLPRESSLYEAKFILFAGDSAGATGVMLNLDKVNKFVQHRFNTLKVNCTLETSNACDPRQAPILRGLADSGWFLDNEPYDYNYDNNQSQDQQPQAQHASPMDESDCDRQRCSPLQSIRQAMVLWNGQVPLACSSRYPTEPWRCYFAYRSYQTLKTPLFVVQWLYDEVQLMANNIGRPDTNSKWNYVNKLASELRASLENVTALFAPSCFSHSLITKQSWNQININGFKLPHVLNSWEEETLSNQPTYEALLAIEQDINHPISMDGIANNGASNSQSNYNSRPALSLRQTNMPRIRGRKRKRNNHSKSSLNTNRLSRSTSVDDATLPLANNVPDNIIATTSSASSRQESDRFRLVDTCGWPQCNRDCPGSDSDYNLRTVLSY